MTLPTCSLWLQSLTYQNYNWHSDRSWSDSWNIPQQEDGQLVGTQENTSTKGVNAVFSHPLRTAQFLEKGFQKGIVPDLRWHLFSSQDWSSGHQSYTIMLPHNLSTPYFHMPINFTAVTTYLNERSFTIWLTTL